MADLFQEIMDDVRADRAGQLWKNYGKWVIYAAVSIVLVTAGVVFWKNHERDSAMEQTALYFSASNAMAKGEAEAALATLETISLPERSPMYGMVQLKKAQVQQALGKDAEAKTTLASLAKREDVYGDVGRIMLKEGAKEKNEKATPLATSREEWAAWDQLAAGDKANAAAGFQALAAREQAPESLRERARTMATYLTQKAGQ